MFWRKKKQVAASVEVSPASAATIATGTAPVASAGATSAAVKVDAVRAEKLSGPKPIPEVLGNYLIKKLDKDEGWVWRLSAVVRPRAAGDKGYDVRIFASHEAAGRNIKVRNYISLDEYPGLIIFEGIVDDTSALAFSAVSVVNRQFYGSVLPWLP